MTLGYLRVSTTNQTIENQEYALLQYAQKYNLKIDNYMINMFIYTGVLIEFVDTLNYFHYL